MLAIIYHCVCAISLAYICMPRSVVMHRSALCRPRVMHRAAASWSAGHSVSQLLSRSADTGTVTIFRQSIEYMYVPCSYIHTFSPLIDSQPPGLDCRRSRRSREPSSRYFTRMYCTQLSPGRSLVSPHLFPHGGKRGRVNS